MPKLPFAVALFLLAGCTCPPSAPQSASPKTQPAPLIVNMDGNGDLSIGGGAVSVAPLDLPLLVTEAGPNRPVILNGVGNLQKLVSVRQELRAAGFTNVTIGAVAGG